jgi:hypothetical protein
MSQLTRRARDLIETVGDADGPTSAQKSRVRSALLARVGATAAAGSVVAVAVVKANSVVAATVAPEAAAAGATAGITATVASSSLALVVAKGLAVLAFVGAAGYVALSRPEAPPAAIHALAPQPKRADPPVAPTPPVVAQVPAAHAAPAPPAVAPAAPPRVDPAPRPASPAPPVAAEEPKAAAPTTPAPAPSLDQETADLASVLAALHDGRPEQALAMLDQQDSAFSSGMLAEERAATRIDALCALHRMDEARAAAALFLRDHPRSLNAARVKTSCGGSVP